MKSRCWLRRRDDLVEELELECSLDLLHSVVALTLTATIHPPTQIPPPPPPFLGFNALQYE